MWSPVFLIVSQALHSSCQLLTAQLSNTPPQTFKENYIRAFGIQYNGFCPPGCICVIQRAAGRTHSTAIVNSEEELQPVCNTKCLHEAADLSPQLGKQNQLFANLSHYASAPTRDGT